MSKNATDYGKSHGICFIEINNATDIEAKILRGIIKNEAAKLNPKIQIEVHDSRLYYNEPKKLYQEID